MRERAGRYRRWKETCPVARQSTDYRRAVAQERSYLKEEPMPERRNRQANGEAELLHTLRTAAQQIWMVGLSTLARTQEEGGKVLGALKNEGKRGGRSARVSAGITDQAG